MEKDNENEDVCPSNIVVDKVQKLELETKLFFNFEVFYLV